MKLRNRIAIAGAVVAALIACGAPAARASAQKHIRYLRPLPFSQQDGILGPGGATRLRGIIDQSIFAAPKFSTLGKFTLSVAVTQNVPGCGTAATSTSADTFLVVWPSACVLSGNAATVLLSTTGDQIVPVRAFYANAAGDSIAPALPTTPFPGSSPPPLAAMTALLALTGVALIWRRRPAA